MLYNPKKKSVQPIDVLSQKKQCSVCPLRRNKDWNDTPINKTDILLLTDKVGYQPIESIMEYRTTLSYMVECGVMGSENTQTAKSCCLGRKLDVITQARPKIVICSGYDAFKAIEGACGNEADGRSEDFFFPTRYKDHDFWLIQIPEYEVADNIANMSDAIRDYMNEEPMIWEGNYDGVELVTRSEQIDEAFAWLEKQEYLGFDIETVDLRPYKEKNVVLSFALGTIDKVYSFPLFHPQTPEDFDVAKLLYKLYTLRGPKLIVHNGPFEMERMQHLFNKLFDDANKWLYEMQWEDTQAQSYNINMPNKRSKSLNSCCRRAGGLDLKSMSNLDVTKLYYTPLEQVLTYNALDSKYTHPLFFFQEEIIKALDLYEVYRRQVREAQGAVVLQLEGLTPNHEFLNEQYAIWKPEFDLSLDVWKSFPQVKASAAKHGKCEPGSDKDVAALFHEEFGVPETIESFDKNFCATFKHPIASALMRYSECEKVISTYLMPYLVDQPGGGKYIWEDGLIHTQFNTMLTNTGRWSSSAPNGQNYPARGGKKYLRNSIKTPSDDYRIVAIDKSQIEYRVAASLTSDPVMIDGLFNDFDVHMFWALEVLKYFPELLPDHKDKKALKGFRSAMKSAVVFALIYGAGAPRVASSLGVKNINKVYKLVEQFWDKHGAIKEWQKETIRQHNEEGFIQNALGRKYFAPIQYNQICDYPIQGTASDMLIEALTKLAYKQVMEGAPWKLILNIHDDLTFLIHKDKIDDALAEIVPVMLHTESYKSWLKVPLGVEVTIGKTWGAMEEFGTFYSHQL